MYLFGTKSSKRPSPLYPHEATTELRVHKNTLLEAVMTGKGKCNSENNTIQPTKGWEQNQAELVGFWASSLLKVPVRLIFSPQGTLQEQKLLRILEVVPPNSLGSMFLPFPSVLL